MTASNPSKTGRRGNSSPETKTAFDDIASGLEKALDLLRKGHTDEVWTEEIRGILPFIGQLTGEIRSEEIINRIFSHFCVGK